MTKTNFWIKKTSKQKRQFVIYLALILIAVSILSILIFARDIFGQEVGDQILGEGNANGFVSLWKMMVNSSSRWFATIIVLTVSFLAYFFLNVLIKAITLKGRKAQTIGSLITSCIKYLTILIAAGFILTTWGVDVTSIVAGLGILTLIIGLGCQSLISDVVSGIFIVFDDYFSVGDIVIIDGFRGEVVSIGLKSTQLCDVGGNLKSISNSQIISCVNLSHGPSLVTSTININYQEDLEHVEAIIAKNLPTISKNLPKLATPIAYKGVTSFGNAGIGLLFAATCQEDDRYQVGRDMNRDLYLMLKKNGISLTYNEIVVNKGEKITTILANEEEKKASRKINSLNREVQIKTNSKKKPFIERAKEAVKEESDNLKIT